MEAFSAHRRVNTLILSNSLFNWNMCIRFLSFSFHSHLPHSTKHRLIFSRHSRVYRTAPKRRLVVIWKILSNRSPSVLFGLGARRDERHSFSLSHPFDSVSDAIEEERVGKHSCWRRWFIHVWSDIGTIEILDGITWQRFIGKVEFVGLQRS